MRATHKSNSAARGTARGRLEAQRSVLGAVLGVGTLWLQVTRLRQAQELITVVLREAPLSGKHNLLASRELELGTAEGSHHVLPVHILGPHRDEDLSDLHTSHHTIGLAVSVTHPSLQTIRAGAGQHLVDTQHVVRVSSHTHVEAVTASLLRQHLVGGNTGSLKSVAGQL